MAGWMSTREQAPIDHYLRLLGQRLRGSPRLKRDLLTEARDSLRDATEAYRECGLDLIALFLLGPAGRRWALAPRTLVRPLSVVALIVGGLIWALGTFAAVTEVKEWMTVRVIAATGHRPVTT
jgi:hypothetical protein